MSQSPVESQRAVALLDQLIHEYLQQVDEGLTPDRAAMLERHPALATELAAFFEDQDRIARFADRLRFEETIGLAQQPGAAKTDADRSAGELPRSVRYFGRYEILAEIARGGMGVVYKARQARLDRIVALKMILSGHLASSADVARFYSEAQAAANLEHSGIVPIYEVGQYSGQHYFSMAYIEGESLAARLARGPLPEDEAARLVQQLCQAVEYAHERGVIHRDIKPANVLIDADGRPRITDFGLAKQASGDNGLTATGQVLGTPSFMPPEQASGNLAAVGKAVDIYALGAVLYAAVTGRPPFQAPTAVETLLQVRELDPPPPRMLNPAVSRDLETICLKCLEKEPQRRYDSAAEMAEDLRRLLADEPILARRQSLATQATRWLRKRRSAVLLVLASTAAAVALVVGGLEFSRSQEQRRLGKLQLRTSGQTLVAEVFDSKDQPAAPNFPVPNSQPVEVPQGDYKVRLSSPGMVSETYLMEIAAREFTSADVRLENRYLWPPLEMKEGDFVEPIASPGQPASLLWRRWTGVNSFRLVGGVKGDSLWRDDLQFDENNLPAGEDLNQWTNNFPQAPGAVTVAAELDPPLVFIASRQRPTLIAVSIKTGKVVWAHRGRPKLPDGSPDFSKLKQSRFETSPVIGKPLIAVGPDKNPVVVYTSLLVGDVYQTQDNHFIEAGPQQLWLEALDAKSGRSLWRYALPSAARIYDYWEREPVAREAIQQPQLAMIDGQAVVVTVHGSKLTGVELDSGKQAWPPHDLGFEPDVAPKFVTDRAQPKAPLAIFVTGRPRSGGGWSGPALKNKLIGLSLADLTQRWQTTITAPGPTSWPHPSPNDLPQFELAELANGKPMILSPTWQQNPSQWSEGASSLTLIDPQSGAVQWERPLLWSGPFSSTYFQWIVGPDLDGDGDREIFAAWTGNNHGTTTLVAAAFSGRDGHTLWRWTRPNVVQDDHSPHRLLFWDIAESGLPKLVVPVGGASGQRASYVLDAADGRLLETLPEVSDPESADLNGDGLPDLYYTVSPQGFSRLMTLRGAPPTAWRRLDSGSMYPVEDLDGDGVADAVVTRGTDVVAISGRTGRVLWESDRIGGTVGRPSPMTRISSGHGDDSKPAADLLVFGQSWTGDGMVLQRLDGRTGRSLWPSRTPDGDPQSSKIRGSNWYQSIGDHTMQYPAAGTCFLKPDQPDVWGATVLPNGSRASLYLLSGADGSIKWTAPIAPGCFGTPGEVYRDFKDLDGDGLADIVAWRPADNPNNGLQLAAYSGASGKPLWPDAPPVTLAALQDNYFRLPVVADLDGQGAHDIVFIRQQPSQPPPPRGGSPMEVVVVSGKTGQVKWTWPWLNAGGSLVAPLLAVALEGAGPRFIALYITEYHQVTSTTTTFRPMIVVLDHTGKPVLKRTEFKASFSGMVTNQPMSSWWRKADLRGDGHEQLTFLDDSSLFVLGGEKLEPLWRWPLATFDSRLLDVLPVAAGKPATVVVWSGTSVYGLSGATGQARWRGEIATTPMQNAPPVLLPSRDGLPRLLAGGACRLTASTNETGGYAPATGEPRTYEPVADPVWVRPLPWADGQWPLFQMILAAAAATLVWLVVPVLLMRMAIRRNSWQLAFIPALYQLAMAAVANVIPPDALEPLVHLGSYNLNTGRVEFDPRIGVALVTAGMLLVNVVWRLRRRLWVMYDATAIYAIAIAVAWPKTDAAGVFARHMHDFFAVFFLGGGALAAVWLPIQWLARRQYWRLVAFVAVSPIVAGAEAAITLLANRSATDDQPYSWDGWYWIIPIGFFWTAIAVLVFRAGRRPMSWLWRKGTGLIRRRSRH